ASAATTETRSAAPPRAAACRCRWPRDTQRCERAPNPPSVPGAPRRVRRRPRCPGRAAPPAAPHTSPSGSDVLPAAGAQRCRSRSSAWGREDCFRLHGAGTAADDAESHTAMIHRIRTLDAHAAGEPLRLIIDGFPAPEGDTMLAKRTW